MLGKALVSHPCVSFHLCSCPSVSTQAAKHADKKGGDIVPPMPFYMKPNAMSLYLRHKVGVPALIRAARVPLTLINVKAIPKPPGWLMLFAQSKWLCVPLSPALHACTCMSFIFQPYTTFDL